MFFADKPYISDFFKQTVRDNHIPVVGTEIAETLGLYSGTNIISEQAAIELARASDDLRIYTTSENAIGWISKYLAFSDLPEKIALFKDKVKFRELTRSMFPDFYFKEVRVEELNQVKINDIPLPFIIKPAVGFFSMGVRKVTSHADWHSVVESILVEMDKNKSAYPEVVLNASSFIIEQCINGDEYAFDAYFNASGEPVVLSILKHIFASETDVSDRVYTTSKEIIEENLADFTDFAGKIGKLAQLKNFPVHIEVRRENGVLLPIEVNPMRFGGWCTTADISYLAYGFNPYLCYFLQEKPNWDEALKGKEGKLYSLVVLDNSTGVHVNDISSFDFEKLLGNFEKPLELRKINFREHSVFGFLFTETSADNFVELKRILDSNLSEFITTTEDHQFTNESSAYEKI
ncbi:MAG: ATP-grasp domain-containing protein [Anaerolineales bacterium]|nr:ATP-grasp domain-containing protein [Anaerolineales bacterium]